MNLNSRLTRLDKAMTPAREVYQVRFVADDEEARQIEEDEGYEPWRPGDGIRFIMADSWLPEWRAALKNESQSIAGETIVLDWGD